MYVLLVLIVVHVVAINSVRFGIRQTTVASSSMHRPAGKRKSVCSV